MLGQQYRDYGDAEPVTLDRPLWKVPNKTRALFLGLGSRNLRQGGGTSHGARRPEGRTDGGLIPLVSTNACHMSKRRVGTVPTFFPPRPGARATDITPVGILFFASLLKYDLNAIPFHY